MYGTNEINCGEITKRGGEYKIRAQFQSTSLTVCFGNNVIDRRSIGVANVLDDVAYGIGQHEHVLRIVFN